MPKYIPSKLDHSGQLNKLTQHQYMHSIERGATRFGAWNLIGMVFPYRLPKPHHVCQYRKFPIKTSSTVWLWKAPLIIEENLVQLLPKLLLFLTILVAFLAYCQKTASFLLSCLRVDQDQGTDCGHLTLNHWLTAGSDNRDWSLGHQRYTEVIWASHLRVIWEFHSFSHP